MKHIFPLLMLSLLFNFHISAQSNLQWQEIGPDNFGGIIHGLIIDNRDPTRQTLYAGAMGGGVWKTTDGGDWWYYLGCTDNYAISCMTQASNGTIYFGTGVGANGIYALGSGFDEEHAGNGVYGLDSRDSIIHFAFNSDSGQISLSSAGSGINRIAVNPLNGNQFLVATWEGLYQSMDSGLTWAEVVFPPGITGGEYVCDVKWASDGGNVFAAVGLPLESAVKLIMSTDGAQSWYQCTTQENPGFPSTQGRIEIAISPSNPNCVYIMVSTPEGSTYGLYETTNAVDSGNACTWNTLATYGPSFDPFKIGSDQGWYDNALVVSPTDSSKVYVGGVNMYTYSPQTGINKLGTFIDPSIDSLSYVDQFIYVINDLNPDEMYVASTRGVFKSTNAFSDFTFPSFSSSNYHLNAGSFYSIAATLNGQVMGNTSHEGTLINNIQSQSQDFSTLSDANGFCEFSHLDTDYLYVEYYFGELEQSVNNGVSFYSCFDNNIDPEGWGQPSACDMVNEDNAAFINPYLLYETKSAFNTRDSILYTSNGNYLAGDSLLVISNTANTPFTYPSPVNIATGDTIEIPDPVQSRLFFSSYCGIWIKLHALSNSISPDWCKIEDESSYGAANCYAVTDGGNTVYAGTTDGVVLRISGLNFVNYDSLDVSDSLVLTSFLIAAGRSIEGIAVTENDSMIVATIAGYTSLESTPNLIMTVNGGTTWSPMHVGLTYDPAYTCVIDHYNSNNIFVGTEHGIWASNDAGATWNVEDDGMCDVPVYRLRQIPLLNDDCYVLYAATNSRGLWRSFTLTPAGCNTSVGISADLPKPTNDFTLYPNPASNKVQVEFELSETENVKITVFDVTGREIQSMQNFLPAGNQLIQLNTSHLSAGTYLINVESGGAVKTKLLVVE